ncbi:hypothetical protein IFVP18_C150217 [Vibrio parahaemolyticus]
MAGLFFSSQRFKLCEINGFYDSTQFTWLGLQLAQRYLRGNPLDLFQSRKRLVGLLSVYDNRPFG